MPDSAFARDLLAWFHASGREDLPWRRDRAPYRIVVSEFMLQQTQVGRVVPIFEAFVARWPAFEALAAASRADVVRAWKGLGYNSRAIRLHDLANVVVSRYGGALPSDEAALLGLPGIGPYTARAIAAFAFDADAIAFDTNVRRIVHRTQVGIEWPPLANDARLAELASELEPRGSGYAFNSALMDLGATLCTARAPKCLLCPVQTACAAAPIDAARLASLAATYATSRSPQERLRFEETTRFVRGRIVDLLRALPDGATISLLDLHAELASLGAGRDDDAFDRIVANLARDGFVERTGDEIGLAT